MWPMALIGNRFDGGTVTAVIYLPPNDRYAPNGRMRIIQHDTNVDPDGSPIIWAYID